VEIRDCKLWGALEGKPETSFPSIFQSSSKKTKKTPLNKGYMVNNCKRRQRKNPC